MNCQVLIYNSRMSQWSYNKYLSRRR